MARQLKGNPSIISRPNRGVRKFVPGRTSCSLCGEVLHRGDTPRPGADRTWRHGGGCPSDTEYSKRLRSDQVNAAVISMTEVLVSGSDDLWDDLAISVEYEPNGVLARALAIVASSEPQAPGSLYLKDRLRLAQAPEDLRKD